jgi:hypothetical protein
VLACFFFTGGKLRRYSLHFHDNINPSIMPQTVCKFCEFTSAAAITQHPTARPIRRGSKHQPSCLALAKSAEDCPMCKMFLDALLHRNKRLVVDDLISSRGAESINVFADARKRYDQVPGPSRYLEIIKNKTTYGAHPLKVVLDQGQYDLVPELGHAYKLCSKQ